MKVVVTANGKTLEDHVDPRFGRCPYFLVVDTDTMEFEVIENSNAALGGGAGIQSGQLMAEHDVKFILTGNCGPNAFKTLGAADIQVIVGVSGIIRQAVEQFKSGAFSTASDSNVASHFGTGVEDTAAATSNTVPSTQQAETERGIQMGKGMSGGGMGRGMGGGGGQGGGMGGGRGMGRGMGGGGGQGGGMGGGRGIAGGAAIPPPVIGESKLDFLKAQAQTMEEQLRVINSEISQVEQCAVLPGLVAVVDVVKCNVCGICRDVCPTGAITVNEIVQIDTVKCNGCGHCVAECPQSAISLYKAT